MDFPRNSTQQDDGRWVVVTGPSLSETFKKVRRAYGPEAVIAGSRTRSRRKDRGYGTEQVVEVTVDTTGQLESPRRDSAATIDGMTSQIRYEVERLEKLVDDITEPKIEPEIPTAETAADPLTEFLLENGASAGAVRKMLTRFTVETGLPMTDRPGIVTWLGGYLEAGDTTLTEWQGNHAFLGENSGDRLDLVLHLAKRMTEAGRKVLAISILPDPDRDVTRFQNTASAAGFDAAVVRDCDQLEHFENHLDSYDLILTDLPALMDPAMAENSPLQQWLASNTRFQRHLMIPMDRDFQDLDDLRDAARLWNCDSLALTRLEGTRRPAKLLDLVDALPLPVSVMSGNSTDTGFLEDATPARLLDTILGTKTAPRFTPGLAPTSGTESANVPGKHITRKVG
jgi:flagellar biosynthesis GTPase FlhF